MTGKAASAAHLGKVLLRDAGSAALGTLDRTGAPFTSYVAIAPAADASPILLLSHLAAHTRNLDRDSRASLLLLGEAEPDAEALAITRLTLTGRLSRNTADDDPRCFLARHPDAERYAGFGDFSFYRFGIESGHLVAGFGRIVRLLPGDLLDAPADL